MSRSLLLVAALLLLLGGRPVHAQEADPSAADPSATDTSITDTTAADPMPADTAQAEAVPADTTQTDSSAADSASVVADPVDMSLEEERARAAAESWLALIDSSKFGESWDAAASSLREGLTREQWIARGTQVRGRLQALQSRTLRSAQYRDSTAHLPGGPVAILQYASIFDGGSTLEAVITTRQDSTWKVAGYRIVPAPDSVTVPDSVAAPDSTEVPSDTTEAAATSPE